MEQNAYQIKNWIQKFQTLVALMLSSQTKDQITAEVMGRINSLGLTPFKFSKMSLKDIQNIIYPIGFYKVKSKYIYSTSNILLEKYDGDIPNNFKDLLELPGVGPKMALLAMKIAWNETVGIAVDTHVHRLSNRMGLVKSAKNPEQTRNQLESWLPKEYWSSINHLLVGFGQQICTPISPKCSQCLNTTLCPYFLENKPSR
ncbi:endonuclease III-like protein 1 [Gordionus sp. m RMFG-2023]|uniref:endonuclease III-like protein 1 n=1 Tax=Gordionus sp. m RMFG-2023 TaxID=3053472 RepID=UPI0031FBFE94